MKEDEEIEAIEKERAKLRKAATQMAGKDKEGKPVNASVVSNLPPPKEVGKTREKVAREVRAEVANLPQQEVGKTREKVAKQTGARICHVNDERPPRLPCPGRSVAAPHDDMACPLRSKKNRSARALHRKRKVATNWLHGDLFL